MSEYFKLLQEEHDLGEAMAKNLATMNNLRKQQEQLQKRVMEVIKQINEHPENPKNKEKITDE